MIALEITLLIVAYTLIIITIFLEIICYKRNMEALETIAFTVSLLLLIVSLTISPALSKTNVVETASVFTLISMILVGLTTPLSIMTERRHKIPSYLKKLLFGISILLLVLTVSGHFMDTLDAVQYPVIVFLGLSVISSMILVRITKPQKWIAHREKTERIFAIAFIVIVPISLLTNFAFTEENYSPKVGFTLPLVFILLATSKLLDNLKRLSLFKSNMDPKEQHFKNYSLTDREKEIAILLTKGTTYKQIAEQLFIAMPTVKTHAGNIYKKCGVNNRSELTMLLIS